MELDTALEILRKRFTSESGSIHESDFRIVHAIEFAVKRQMYDAAEIRSLRAAIVARFVTDNTVKGDY